MNTTPTIRANGCRGIRPRIEHHAPPPPARTHRSSPASRSPPARRALRRDPHARGARVPRRAARPLRAHPARAARGAPADPRRRGERPRPEVPARDRVDPQRPVVARRRRRPGPRGPPRRDHRPDRPEDGDQRAELRREGVARRPGGRHEPHLGERDRGAAEPARLPPRNLEYTSPEGKEYRVTAAETPTIVMRPRGWHLVEKHLRFHDRAGRAMHASGSLVDFGLYFFHNAQALIAAGRGPYFYLPKLESHREAKLWNDIFVVRAGRARHPAGHDPRDRAHRDDPGRVPDGRDPLRAARPLRRPQRRPLGLHLLDREDVPLAGPPLGHARPQVDHHDGAVHAGLHRAARRRRATSAARTRSAA